MRITFPHMGNLYIALEAIFANLGIEVVVPPVTSKETINIGTKNTPEAACLPFKIVVGNFAQAIDAGADTIIMLGGKGPCRFGYFGSLAEGILKDMGYKFDMIILENDNMVKMINDIREKTGLSIWQVLEAVRFGWTKLKATDIIEKETLKCRPKERKPGIISKLFDEGIFLIRQARNIKEVEQVKNKCISAMNQQTVAKKTLRVGLVGDIYMMIEPAVNHRIERLLGALGVEVHRSIFVSDWLKHSLLPHKIYNYKKRLLGAGKPYLNGFVGGHGLDSVANSVIYAKDGYDGVIQILPMTCMPEIVAQSVLPIVQQDFDIPIMTMVLDEQSGEAGFSTRIEAFIDLLQKRKEQNLA